MTTTPTEPFDDDAFIDECLRTGVGAPAYVRWPAPSWSCRWCRHTVHGLPCSPRDCGCDSAYTSRDDSWRPSETFIPTNPYRVMHDTGVDGWTATAVCGWNVQPGFNPTRMRALLLGKGL